MSLVADVCPNGIIVCLVRVNEVLLQINPVLLIGHIPALLDLRQSSAGRAPFFVSAVRLHLEPESCSETFEAFPFFFDLRVDTFQLLEKCRLTLAQA